MSVVRVFTFERGGELAWVAGGLALGAVLSIVPVEVVPLLLWLPLLLLTFVWRAIASRRARVARLLFVLGAIAVMIAAGLAPVGYGYQRVHVSKTTMTLRELAIELRAEEVSSEDTVTLPSVDPTWREAEAAIREQTSMRLIPTGLFAASLLEGYPRFGLVLINSHTSM